MTEGNMAYQDALSLVEELNMLLDIPFKILHIKKLQAGLFIDKIGEILRILEMEGTSNFSEQSVEEILHLALPIGDLFKGPGIRILRSKVMHILPTYYGWEGKFTREVPEIVERIGLIENKLEKFLGETDLHDVWEDLRNNLPLLHSRLAVRDLLQANQNLKEAINFFHEVNTESALLCKYLRFLHMFLETSQAECSHELVEGIRDVVRKALDAVRCPDKDRLSSQMRMFEEDVLLPIGWPTYRLAKHRRLSVHMNLEYCSAAELFDEVELVEDDAWLDSGIINIKENCIEKQVRNFFDGKNCVRLVFLDTLGKLHSFKGEIDMITKALGKNCLQPWDPSFGSLQLFTSSSHVPKKRRK